MLPDPHQCAAVRRGQKTSLHLCGLFLRANLGRDVCINTIKIKNTSIGICETVSWSKVNFSRQLFIACFNNNPVYHYYAMGNFGHVLQEIFK